MIQVKNVWKIFGNQPQVALDAIKSKGLTKAQVLEQFDCVLAVADVSIDVNEGEVFCIMGLSGSGKSTLVRHFNRLLEPTSGEIIIDGTNMMNLTNRDLQKFRNERTGMVFQSFALMPHRSVLDNVAMPLEIRGIGANERLQQASEVLEIVELSMWGDKLVHELSGGMQQRVGLARAISANPDLLLMDEPFSALDPLIRKQMQDEFIKLSKKLKKTTVFITHDLDEAVRIGDRVAIMKDGYIEQIGTPEEIVMSPATDYVAEFVAGISRLKMVKANAIMQPLNAHEFDLDTSGFAKIEHDATFEDTINLAISSGSDIIVTKSNRAVGIIKNLDIMKTMVEDPETS